MMSRSLTLQSICDVKRDEQRYNEQKVTQRFFTMGSMLMLFQQTNHYLLFTMYEDKNKSEDTHLCPVLYWTKSYDYKNVVVNT
jgi:hypothetical protein